MTDTRLISALQQPQIYDHPVGEIRLLETHISWVILTGEFVYKVKKPVNLGFLDFSTLELRKQYCEQELELNRRLAPQLYLEVVALTGAPDTPVINGSGEPFEYAVKMRQFDPEQQLDKLLQRNELTSAHIDQLADTIAGFHDTIECAEENNPYGSPTAVWQPMQENFDQIRSRLQDDSEQARLDRLQQWSKQRFDQLKGVITERKRQGFVRNCHGDMHLANITLVDGKVTVFDCIEFNDYFRWIDVISEIAFTTMDLIDRGRPDLSARLLDRYLQRSGDYAGLALLRFYQVYRALVRAKVAMIRHSQAGLTDTESEQSLQQYRDYSHLAESFTHTPPATLYIAHGVSGSGKTTLTQPLLERHGMIRLRSDVERKRLFGLSAEAKSRSETGAGIYTQSASEQTYQRLRQLARQTLEAGYSTIIDATFLKRDQRRLFQTLAQELDLPFVILHFHADKALLRQWISERLSEAKDASEANLEVLEHQLKTEEPLNEDEAGRIIAIDSGRDDAVQILLDQVS
jgi:aminoglycoside phosphotransferase family enzyme/predicted kinase